MNKKRLKALFKSMHSINYDANIYAFMCNMEYDLELLRLIHYIEPFIQGVIYLIPKNLSVKLDVNNEKYSIQYSLIEKKDLL